MAVMGAAYQIGRSALAAYQAAVTVTGQNIANVGNPDYTRQSGRLAAMYGGMTAGGIAPGTGVRMDALQRHADEALEARLRLARGARSGAETEYQLLNRIEALYNELSDQDLSSLLENFFGSFTTMQTDPLERTTRNLALSSADAIIDTLQRQRSGLLNEIEDLNQTAEALAREANSLSEQIAELNALIVEEEARGQGAGNALRDRRDALLRDLGEMMDITTREQDSGVVNVYVGSEPLVDFGRSRGIAIQVEYDDGIQRSTVRFADNGGNVIMREGKLAAVVNARDESIIGQLEQLDSLAHALIYEVNRVHTSGQGLAGWQSITGSYAVTNPNVALNDTLAGLRFPVENGSFYVHMRDRDSGQTISRLIEVDLDGLNGNDTTLASLAAALHAVPDLSATVTADNRLQLDAGDGYEIRFSEDTSGALAALGIGTFFEGYNATTIAINPQVQNNPDLIAASLSGAPGDGDNAARIAALSESASALLGGQSISNYHASMITSLAVEVGAAETAHEAADAVYSSLLAQREATSGVSLDEEAINLTKFERSYQGAARFMTVIDSLSSEILALVG